VWIHMESIQLHVQLRYKGLASVRPKSSASIGYILTSLHYIL
jgi:hypothetical protein